MLGMDASCTVVAPNVKQNDSDVTIRWRSVRFLFSFFINYPPKSFKYLCDNEDNFSIISVGNKKLNRKILLWFC
jgi:hypothetical protein